MADEDMTPIVFWKGEEYRGILYPGVSLVPGAPSDIYQPYVPLGMVGAKVVLDEQYPTRERMMREHPEFYGYRHEEVKD